MLQELSIQNFALIEDQAISFGPQLNILSGETGAGKSIIIDAVGLLMGKRLQPNLIRSGADTAQLEAFFDIDPASDTAQKMHELDFDPEDGLLIRRTFSVSQRPRIYINNHLSTAQTLTELTQHLLSISGQHAHQRLLSEDTHLETLDLYADLFPLKKKVGDQIDQMRPLIDQLEELHVTKKNQKEKISTLEFQQNEIAEAGSIEPNEDDTLSQQRSRLKNAETIYTTLAESVRTLYSQPDAVMEKLTLTTRPLEKLAELDPSITPIITSLSEVTFQLEDVVSRLEKHLRSLELDGMTLDDIDARLTILSRLKRKYGPSLNDVIEQKERIEHELSQITNVDAEIGKIEKTLSEKKEILSNLSHELSQERKKTASALCAKIESVLSTLKMPHAKLHMVFDTISARENTSFYLQEDNCAFTSTGVDRAVFRFSANPGEGEKPLVQIASGGELSRVVLAIKVVLSEKGSVETIIFDEVDAGIGGSVAEAVGQKLKELSSFHQIICITHLPQIAKFGATHFVIEKEIQNGRTQTHIRPLSDDDRVCEIARMLGGATITQTTLQHAKELLSP